MVERDPGVDFAFTEDVGREKPVFGVGK